MAADPISLAASIIALAETGMSVGRFLLDNFRAYKNAPEELLEISHEVNICCSLITPFGEKLRSCAVKYNASFQECVEWLIRNSRKTFKSIQDLLPRNRDGEIGATQRWKLDLDKSKVDGYRKKLREMQQMFVFVKELMMDAGACEQAPPPALGASGQFPIVLTGTGEDSNGNAVSYSAQVMMQQFQASTPKHRTKARHGRRRRADLAALRQSPYFASDLLRREREPAGKHYEWKARAEKREDAAMLRMPSEDAAGREVEKLATLWFGDPGDEGPKARRKADRRSRSRSPDAGLSSETPGTAQRQDYGESKPRGSDGHLPLDRGERSRNQDYRSSTPASSGPDTHSKSAREARRRGDNRRTRASPDRNVPSEKVRPTRGEEHGFSMPMRPDRDPSPQARSGVNRSRSPSYSETRRSRSPSDPFVICDACRREIFRTRFNCQSCSNFDLCRTCFGDQLIMSRLQHEHPKSHFAERSADDGLRGRRG